MTNYSFENNKAETKRLWETMRIIRDGAELQRVSDKIAKHKATYLEVEKATGVPWQMVGVIHLREAGEQDIGRFKGVLHNGEMIVGTGKKTRLVPARRGPFNTWFDAAVDALRIEGFLKIKEWPIERVLWELEPFNGYGYRNKGLRSPYIWASTNHQQPGKYVSDGVFNASVMDSQVGCAALLKYLNFGVVNKPTSVPSIVVAGTAGAVATGGYLAHSWEYAVAAWPYIAVVSALGVIIGIIGYIQGKK